VPAFLEITNGVSDAAEIADETLMIPETNERAAPVLANVQLQCFPTIWPTRSVDRLTSHGTSPKA